MCLQVKAAPCGLRLHDISRVLCPCVCSFFSPRPFQCVFRLYSLKRNRIQYGQGYQDIHLGLMKSVLQSVFSSEELETELTEVQFHIMNKTKGQELFFFLF